MPRRRLRVRSLHKSGQPLETTKTIDEILGALGYPTTQFDAVLVTDGSGTSVGNPTGSAVRLKQRNKSEELLHSRSSSGTNQTAELDAVLIGLRYLSAKKAYAQTKGCRTLVVTDSQLVQRMVDGIAKDPIKLYNDSAHYDAAAALLAFARRGFIFTVYRLSRNITPVHAGVDAASRAARLLKDPDEAYRIASQKTPRIKKKKENGKESSE